MRIIVQIVILIGIPAMISCYPKDRKIKLQTGDILFRKTVSSDLSKAINEVTQTELATHFSHVGLVELVNDTPTVLHASFGNGTCRVSLKEFVNPAGDSAPVVTYRLKANWRNSIPTAIERAKSMLGKPYNFSYILSDTAYYCSEFIYRAFELDSIFEMNPMTFKDPNTGDFQKTWVEYYQRLGIEIPEGLPGCNPNGMAASDKLMKLGELK